MICHGPTFTPFVAANHLVPQVPTGFLQGPAATLISSIVPGITEWVDVVTITCTTTGVGATIAWVADVDITQGPPIQLPMRNAWGQ